MDDLHSLEKKLIFIQRAENLKNTIRRSVTSQGRPESSAEHSWRLALMALVFEDELPGLDACKILKLCLVHDLGEAISGDIPAIMQKGGTDKAEKEWQDFLELTSVLPEPVRTRLLNLWEEYENAASPEAALVKGLDKLETLVQHNQGQKVQNLIDFNFNLEYGREHMAAHPLLQALRTLIDPSTRQNANSMNSQTTAGE